MDRVVFVAKLKPGSEDAAADIVRSGPPYDPTEIGLARHGVYLGDTEVVFVFEGSDVERQLRDLLNDPVGSPAFAIWAPLLEGTPSIAHELYYWETTPEPDAQLKRGGYDLIVLGTRGRGRTQEGLLGSVNGYIHFHAQIPLLSVPDKADD